MSDRKPENTKPENTKSESIEGEDLMMWTADQLKDLRYRLGWSQAEMARHLECGVEAVFDFETGRSQPSDSHRQILVQIYTNAESNSERVQRRPVAEVIMHDRGLTQIHDFDVIENIASGPHRKNEQ